MAKEIYIKIVKGCEVERIRTCSCCWCRADSFRDELSEREYHISGLCQKCQDKIFDDRKGEE